MTTDPSPVLTRLRAAASRLDDLDRTGAEPGVFDPGEHAERFEAVHEALVAVLAEADGDTDDQDRA